MDETRDGFAYLETLRRNGQGMQPSFSAFAQYLDTKARAQGVPLSGQFELTPLCNFQCRMCYVQMAGSQLSQPLLTADQWKDLMAQAVEAGMLRPILTGGECLAYPGFREVYEHLQALGCEITLMTNGALLDQTWVDYFLRRRPGMICITLYGDSNEAYQRVTGHAAFDTVVRNIRAIREAGLPLTISVTPNRYLGEDVFGTLRLAKELCPALRVNAWLTDPRGETGRDGQIGDLTQSDYIRIFRYRNQLEGIPCTEYPLDQLPPTGGPSREGSPRGLTCGGGRSSFSVDWKGVMSPCNELEMIRAYPLRDGFGPAWAIINRAANEWPRAIECEGCAYAPICVRCAGRTLRYTKPGTRSTALCGETLQMVHQGVYRLPECE